MPACPVCGAPSAEETSLQLLAAAPALTGELPPPPRPTPAVVAQVAAELLAPPRPVTLPPTVPAQADKAAGLPTVPGYAILGVLGRGGMGVVYLARQPELNRTVALKMVLAGGHASSQELARFHTEAEAVARLQHPHIIQIYGVGRHDDHPYLVLEYVDGGSLAQQLTGAPWPAQKAAELVETLAQAMNYAHQRGIVHRDLTPGNVLLTVDGQPKITDFGLAKLLVGGGAVRTQSGAIMGTPSYMAPEQAAGKTKEIGPAVDVYGLGAILYELLTGRPPFRAETPLETLLQVQAEEPVPPSRLQPKLPRDLGTICLKALAKAPQQRYASAQDLADDLHRWRNGEPIRARPVSAWERGWAWAKRRPAAAGLLAVVALVAVVGFPSALWLWRRAETARAERETDLYFHRIALAHRELTASLPKPGRAEELLDACPPEQRRWEWHYLKRLWRIEPVVFQDPGHKEVNSVVFSPDGRHVAAASGDGSVRIYDLERRAVARTLSGHRGYVFSVAYSPDGKHLASASADKTIRVWDLTADKEPFTLPGDAGFEYGMAYSVSFSPDGQRLAAISDDPTAIRIWDVAARRVIHTLPGHEVKASSVAFRSDGLRLATGDWQGTVRVWDAITGQQLQVLRVQGHDHPVASVAFSPDGQLVAAAQFDHPVKLWKATTGELVHLLRGHTELLLGVAFTPDGQRLVSCGMDRTIRLWDVASGRGILTLGGHASPCQCLAFSPDGWRLVSAGMDETVKLWDATPLQENEGQELLTFREHPDQVWSVAFSPNGRHVASGGSASAVKVWDATTGQVTFESPAVVVAFSLAFSRDGQYLAYAAYEGGGDLPHAVPMWDMKTFRQVFTCRSSGVVFHAKFSPDGRYLATAGTADDCAVQIRELSTGQILRTLPGHEREVWSLSFSKDGQRLASGGNDGTVIVWDPTSGQRINSFRRQQHYNSPVVLSPDGQQLIAAGRDGVLRIWDVTSGQEIQVLGGHFSGTWGLEVSPDGHWIAAGGPDCTVKVWDARTGKLCRTFRGHTGTVTSVAFSPDGQRLVSGSYDHTVKVWDLTPLDK